jgi:hypothetical protein
MTFSSISRPRPSSTSSKPATPTGASGSKTSSASTPSNTSAAMRLEVGFAGSPSRQFSPSCWLPEGASISMMTDTAYLFFDARTFIFLSDFSFRRFTVLYLPCAIHNVCDGVGKLREWFCRDFGRGCMPCGQRSPPNDTVMASERPPTKGVKIKNVLKSAARIPQIPNIKGRRSIRRDFASRPGETPFVILRLQVISCSNLLAKDRGGTSDPYARYWNLLSFLADPRLAQLRGCVHPQ